MDFVRYDSPFMTVMRKTGGLIILNFLFLIGCIPIVTAGASLSALYYAVQKNIIHDRSYPWTAFFDGFRKNLRQTIPVGCGFMAVFALFAADIRLFRGFLENGHTIGMLYLACILVLALELVYAVWMAALIARFQNTTRMTLKNAAFLMLRHPLVSFMILAMIISFSMLMYLMPLVVMIAPALMVWLISLSLEKIFYRYMDEEQRNYVKED